MLPTLLQNHDEVYQLPVCYLHVPWSSEICVREYRIALKMYNLDMQIPQDLPLEP